MNVILINAPYPLPGMYGLKGSLPLLVYKHLGIGYIATGLENQGHKVNYLDCPALGMDGDAAIDYLKNESVDLVGIPCFGHGKLLVYDLVKRIRESFPDLPVVLGGPHVTLFADEIFDECSDISIALCGEAEITFAELVTRIEKNQPIEEVPGIVYRNSDGSVQHGPPPEIIDDLDTIPFPARHIYQSELYNPIPMTLTIPYVRADQIITSRGCNWGKCGFCYQTNVKMPCYRRRSPENVIAELSILVNEYGVKFMSFVDDDFLRDEQWIERFCDLYKQNKFTFQWKAMGRVSMVTSAMLQRVASCGCVHVTYGFESGNQETLNLIRKGTTLEQARKAVKWSHKAGLLVRGYFIFGLPRETPEMAEKTLQFAIELNLDYVTFGPYHYMEGTPLEKIALQEGHCVDHDNLNLLSPSYVPDTYRDVEHLKETIQDAYRRFYLRPRYILRSLWSVKNPKLWPGLLPRLWAGLQITLFANK